MAAMGIAMSAPAIPNKELKAKSASRETNGLTPTALRMTRGTSKLFSNLLNNYRGDDHPDQLGRRNG